MIFIMIRRHQGLYSNGPLSPVRSKMACDHCNGKKLSVLFCKAWRELCVWGWVFFVFLACNLLVQH